MVEPLLVLMAFAIGFIFRHLGMPPLLGYLLAGFVAGVAKLGEFEQIQLYADLGVLLLLFTIGLKLNFKQLAAAKVWGTTLAHTLIVVPLTALMLLSLPLFLSSVGAMDFQSAAMLGFALSFSSTVFAVKIFDERGEASSLHARIAIGILVMQDLLAVLYLVGSADYLPSPWALCLLGLPLLRPLLQRLLEMAGHGELLLLFGFGLAMGAGSLFEALHLKAGLGALCIGALLAGGNKSNELYKSLGPLKDLLLTAFFLSVGYYGLPSGDMIVVALLLSALVFLRPLIYFLVLVAFRLRVRTSLLAGVGLFTYSEFGLIVAALAVQAGKLEPEWLTTLAVAMALSLFIAAPFNTRIHSLYARFASRLQKLESQQLHAEEKQVDLGAAEIVVFGMGRIGSGAYEFLNQRYPGLVVGVEEDADKANRLLQQGVKCCQGDVSDRDFLERAKLGGRRLILVCLSNHSENVQVVKFLNKVGFSGKLAAISRFPDHELELRELGCVSFNLYAEAGHGFAEHVLEELGECQTSVR
ncbi:cation:proton antiporter [Spongiibacter sp. KMU-158]|uniref:Cation:proton antiporter n=1 Tax=Spongiibacter pelagi TaxID=2760804 RepID=A0A927GVH1_9GAMM|nr:cation:proton antiporter family protein [Spongiibacter pelagi]MBD2858661.1 cation:proton antiporter [Spongiibacter pelagi]